MPMKPARERLPRVTDVEFPAGRRVVAISDIHGNLPFLKGHLSEDIIFKTRRTEQ